MRLKGKIFYLQNTPLKLEAFLLTKGVFLETKFLYYIFVYSIIIILNFFFIFKVNLNFLLNINDLILFDQRKQ